VVPGSQAGGEFVFGKPRKKENTLVKKSTRRSWALTAAFALLATVFAGAPAQAAGEVTLGVAKGDIYAVSTTDTFKLNAALGVGVNNSFATQLKFKVANSAGANIEYTVSGTADSYFVGTSTSNVVAGNANATTAGAIELAISNSSSVSATTSVVVTAFVDADNDSAVDDGEWQASRTITFYPYTGVTATAVMGALVEDTTTAQNYTATVTFTNVNVDEMDDSVAVAFKVNNATSASQNIAKATGVATVSGTVSAAATFSALVTYNGVEIVESGTVSSTDRTIDAVSVAAVVGDNIKQSGAGTAAARPNSTFTVQMLTSTSSSDLVGVATNGTYAVTTDETLATAVTLGVGGTTHTTTSTLPTASAFTTDATGKANLTLTTVGFAAGSKITVSVTVQRVTTTLEITQTTVSYTVKAVDGQFAYTTPGGSVVLSYTVKDQWGANPTGVAQRLRVDVSGGNQTAQELYGAVAAGAASVTVTGKPTTASGNATAAVHLEKQSATNLNWSTDTAATTTSTAVTVKFNSAAIAFGTKPASDSASVSGATATISGSVNHAGGSVAISGAGLTFTNTEGTTTSDAMTIRTAANGLFTVSAHSKVAGKYPVTVTAGTYSQAIVITIDDIDAAAATVMSITQVGGGSYVTPGSTLRVKVTMTDANGNLAKNSGASLSMTVTGPGFVGTLPTKTDKNGEATLNVLVGANDTGTITVEGSFAGTKTVTSSAEFTVGTAPAEASTAKVTLGTFQGYAALFVAGADGSKLSVKFAGKWYVVPSIDSGTKGYFLWKRNTGAGYPANVTVYIDGKPVDIKVNGEMVGTTASIVTK
jgi:hypothetical protein